MEEREPLVGNYFVSAYPPFSRWTEAGVEDYRGRLSLPRPPDREARLGLYVHVPFCVERCQYCYYLAHDDRPGEIEGYLDGLAREAALYAGTPALSGRRPSFVYFGGGTPSLLSVDRIGRVMRDLQAAFPWAGAEEVSFECSPKTVTAAKLRVLRELGVTRLSLGVQQLDDDVLARNGRVHLVADVERAYGEIQAAGFDVVNLDLMAGLVGETDASFRRSMERVIELSPDSVTIYLLEIPMNTPLYRSLRDGTLPSQPAPWEVKRARVDEAFARLAEAGYTRRSAYAAVRDPQRHRFVYQDAQYRGEDLLGIGVSAFSYLAGVHHQNQASLERYLERVSKGRLPLYRAYALSERERMVRELVLQLKLGSAATGYFRDKFGIELRAEFGEVFSDLERQGWLRADDDAVTLTPDGLLRADRLVTALYLPKHRGVRYS